MIVGCVTLFTIMFALGYVVSLLFENAWNTLDRIYRNDAAMHLILGFIYRKLNTILLIPGIT